MALPPVFSGGRVPSSYRCLATVLLPRTRRHRPPTGSVPPPPPRSYAAGRDPASRIHVPASPSTLSDACTRRDTSCLPISPPTLPSPQPRIAPAGIHYAVHPVH
ncbi:hypothetical protein TRIUR3_29339 [Triticum urartu]|uniref:Uncharacterized protein n=1 Tax=Triticum urartu TaxID=4572 RepID=M7ZHB6_TRIUA|nr:hypothetical protein TRIUR3_29339 [Triticum urartu]